MAHNLAHGPQAGRSNVIPFPRREASPARLTICDRMDITSVRDAAYAHGYDRLVIQERTANDPPEFDNFLSVFRCGESWSCWTLARSGAVVSAWCSVTGKELGRFSSVAAALTSLLEGRREAPVVAEVIRAFA